jgi:hypothetical protein
MTKKEAIDFIRKCANSDDAPFGFMVVGISREDLACHHSDEVVEEFDKLSKRKKEKALSAIADEMNDKYQDWNFSPDIEDMEMDFESLVIE